MCVFERMDDPLAPDNPLTQDVKGTFIDALTQTKSNLPKITAVPKISGPAGLGSRDVRAGDFLAITKATAAGTLQRLLRVGIKHPLALPMAKTPTSGRRGPSTMRGHSVGGYGSVTTNKVIADFAGEVFGKQVQAYPKYGSEKKGLPTTYY